MRKALFLALIATGCYDTSSAPSCRIQCATDTDCTDGLTCGPGGLCTEGEDCLSPATCTPNEFIACVDDMARSCNATGDGTADTACTSGCNTPERRCNDCVPNATTCSTDMMTVQQCSADGRQQTVADTCAAGCAPQDGAVAPHCRYLAPAWLENICDMPATEDSFAPNASATISTALNTTCTGGVITQTVGPKICVVRAKTITIASGITTRFTGAPALALVADSALTIGGTLDISADQATNANGPGAVRVSGNQSSGTQGGGGAGFGTAGGNGGSTATGGGAAGGPSLDPQTLSYFGGGARGGTPSSGPIVNFSDIQGGAGGGGALLIACRGTVSVTGIIAASGAGGRGNQDTISGAQIAFSDAASGGGSGGFVVLQGLAVNVSGRIFANGGGGGGTTTANDAVGPSGTPGLQSTTGASGGAGTATGGTGGAGNSGGTPGGGSTNAQYAAGGGGGVGVIHMYTPTGTIPVVTGATMSPSYTRRPSVLR